MRDRGNYAHYFDGRGNNRFDDWWSLGLSARYQFPIFKRMEGWVRASVENVFNNDTLIRFDTNGVATTDSSGNLAWEPGPFFGDTVPVDYQPPRSYLFTLGIAF